MRSIIIIGNVSAGKTTLARGLAVELNSGMICIDQMWENKFGQLKHTKPNSQAFWKMVDHYVYSFISREQDFILDSAGLSAHFHYIVEYLAGKTDRTILQLVCSGAKFEQREEQRGRKKPLRSIYKQTIDVGINPDGYIDTSFLTPEQVLETAIGELDRLAIPKSVPESVQQADLSDLAAAVPGQTDPD